MAFFYLFFIIECAAGQVNCVGVVHGLEVCAICAKSGWLTKALRSEKQIDCASCETLVRVANVLYGSGARITSPFDRDYLL